MRLEMAKVMEHPAAKARHILSAAAALGGKMSTTTIQIPITSVYEDGDYTGVIEVGSQKTHNAT